jgi:hypothetical protein
MVNSMKHSILVVGLAAALSVLLALIFSLFIFVEPYQVESTADWSPEAQEILRENFPHGSITEEQWRRLRELNGKQHFMQSYAKLIWKDIFNQWWWFVIFPIIFYLLLNWRCSLGALQIVLLMFPSAALLLCSIVLGR